MIALLLLIAAAVSATDSIRKRAPKSCIEADMARFQQTKAYKAFSDNYTGCMEWEMAGADPCFGKACKALVDGIDAVVKAAPHCYPPDTEDRTVKDMYSEFAEELKETWNARCSHVRTLPKAPISEICTKFLFGNNE